MKFNTKHRFEKLALSSDQLHNSNPVSLYSVVPDHKNLLKKLSNAVNEDPAWLTVEVVLENLSAKSEQTEARYTCKSFIVKVALIFVKYWHFLDTCGHLPQKPTLCITKTNQWIKTHQPEFLCPRTSCSGLKFKGVRRFTINAPKKVLSSGWKRDPMVKRIACENIASLR